MSPGQQRRKSGPAEAPKIQDRPAEKAVPKAPVLDPNNRDGEFLPNPTAAPRQGRPKAEKRQLRVVGPKPIGPDGVTAPGWLEMDLTEAQLDALLEGNHVEDWTGVDGWGVDQEDPAPESEQNEGERPTEEGS